MTFTYPIDLKLAGRVKLHEGLRLLPYKCSKGFWTIGYGHVMTDNQRKKYKNGIDLNEAERLFAIDFKKAGICASAFDGFSRLNMARRGVLIEMVFQLGFSGTGKFKKMLSAIKSRDYATAAREMLDSKWHKDTPARCALLASIMLVGR